MLQSVRAHCRPRANCSHLQLLRHLAYGKFSAKRCNDKGAHLCFDARETINFQRPALLCQRHRSSLRSVISFNCTRITCESRLLGGHGRICRYLISPALVSELDAGRNGLQCSRSQLQTATHTWLLDDTSRTFCMRLITAADVVDLDSVCG